MVAHVANWQVVSGAVVLYRTPFVVQIMNIAVLKGIPVMCQQRRVAGKVAQQRKSFEKNKLLAYPRYDMCGWTDRMSF